jgi:hypothetical protein
MNLDPARDFRYSSSMSDRESAKARATDSNPAASGDAEPGAAQRKGGKGCLIEARLVTTADPSFSVPAKGGYGCLIAVLVAVLLLVIAVVTPLTMKVKRKSLQVTAMNNAKCLVLALNDFAAEYGSFPDRESAKAVRRNTHTTLDLDGDSANAYFRQLIAAGMAKSEDPFYVKTPYSPRPPDNNMRGAEALRPGEVGFGYLMDVDKAMDASDPNRIIAVTPLLDATATGEFDAQPLHGKAALVFLDGSVKLMTIREDTRKVTVMGRRTLLETGEGTLWGDTIHPVIKPPLTSPGWRPGQSMPYHLHKQWWFWPVCLLGGGLALALIAAWAVWRNGG